MDFGNPKNVDPNVNKVCSDVVSSLEDLKDSLPKAEGDYLPQNSINLAIGALERFEKLAESFDMSSVALKGKLLDLFSRLDPALQTALGSRYVDLFRDHFSRIRGALEKPDPSKVNPTELDPRGQR